MRGGISVRAVAYVRVSTMKNEQALSLEHQRRFFEDYIVRRGDELIDIYSDKGKSATKMKNRHELQKLIRAAKKKEFDKIYVKDISRLFRNTLDFIEFSREVMDNYGIALHVVNLGDGKDLDSFTLSLMAMLAENESKKIQERIKFGKNESSKNGLVPNFCFGYDHIDSRTLIVNETDAYWVKQIFNLYTEQRWGMARISQYLFEQQVITKKSKDGEPNYNWSQNTVGRVLRNKLYTGLLINGKQETLGIYSGKRRDKSEDEWIVHEKPELRIISDEQFNLAQEIVIKNQELFPQNSFGVKGGVKRSEKYLFSNLIKCSNCGLSYRRYQKRHSENGPMYKWWVCSKRSAYGAGRCNSEHIRIDEETLTKQISYLLEYLIEDKDMFLKLVESKCMSLIREYIRSEDNIDLDSLKEEQSELTLERNNLKKMMVKGLIEIDEGEDDLKSINKRLEDLSLLLNQRDKTSEITTKVKENLKVFSNKFSSFTLIQNMDNAALRQIIREIRVVSADELQVYFNISDDIDGLNFPIRLSDFVNIKTDTNADDRT